MDRTAVAPDVSKTLDCAVVDVVVAVVAVATVGDGFPGTVTALDVVEDRGWSNAAITGSAGFVVVVFVVVFVVDDHTDAGTPSASTMAALL